MEMEKEAFCGAYWHSAGAEPLPVLSSGSASDQPPQSFLNPNWKQSVTYDPDLESALSSLVSSPSSIPVLAGDGAAVGELIGSLGTICSSGEISPCSHRRSGNTSCYSTPLNSPPKLNLSVMDRRQYGQGGLQMSMNPIPSAQFLLLSADPWTEETATRKKFSRISNSKSMNACPGSRIWDPEIGNEAGKLRPPQMAMDIGDGQEESSVSDRISAEASSLRGINDSKARKRKAAAKGKGTYPSTCPLNVKKENSDAKRSKVAETNDAGQEEEAEMETEQKGGAGQKRDKINDAKPPEPPPKDYIHVRARRGQATDAHSLAERVRREKISKRMKFLQDLVPGCNKVTGKAVMLDEIINYVQSLQQQVEFLSMKLATLNPQLDNVENLLSKEMYHTHGPMPLPVYNTDIASAGFPCHHQSQANPIVNLGHEPQFCLSALESSVSQSQSMQLDVLADANSQFGEFWGDELQSFAHIGFRQNQETTFSSQSFHSQMHASHMKLEL